MSPLLVLLACAGSSQPPGETVISDTDDPVDSTDTGPTDDTDPPAEVLVFHVAPTGDDAATGEADAPWATLDGARANLRSLRAAGRLDRPVEVEIAPGTWTRSTPWTFSSEDSGTAAAPITWRGPPGEEVTISGGIAVDGWTLDGADWVTTLAPGTPPPAHLWLDGERRPRAHEPDDGWFYAAATPTDLYSTLVYGDGEVDPRWDLSGALVHTVHDYFGAWETSLLPVAGNDAASRTLTFAGASNWGQYAGNRWTLENVPEALDAPGEWFYDPATRALRYRPKDGEDAATADVVVPAVDQLLRVGDPAEASSVEHLAFRDLRFAYTDWSPGATGYAGMQAVVSEGAAIEVTGGRGLRFERVDVTHTGAHGVWLREGTRDTTLVQCEISDLGAGAVKLGTVNAADDSGDNTVENCFLHGGGRTLPAGEGVWLGQSSHNTVIHNEIADFDYTGIQVGWYWGYSSSTAHDNLVAYNHVHTIGQDVLSDLGGIYTLGVSPGTVVEGNVVHDVTSHVDWGGFGLYADEGTSFVTFTHNLVYNVDAESFHQHYGEANVVTNNILAFGGGAQVRRSRGEDHTSFYFLDNIVFLDDGWTLYDGAYSDWTTGDYRFDFNDWYDPGACELDWAGASWDEWQAAGNDLSSVVADPLFADPWNLDFTLDAASPAIALGFEPFDPREAGLYGDAEWTGRPARYGWTSRTHAPAATAGLADDFETTAVGDPPANATLYGVGGGATIEVTDAVSHAGDRSLELQDQPGLGATYLPFFWYSPSLCGAVTGRFAVKIEKGAVFFHEWRDLSDPTGPYTAGPSVLIDGAGALSAWWSPIGTVPVGVWLVLEIRYTVGASTWELDVTLPDGTVQRYTGLYGQPLGVVDWIGFVANGDRAARLWVDDVVFE